MGERDLVTFARRRWRVLAMTVVAMLATGLFSVLADEGHDPMASTHVEPALGALMTLAPNDTGEVTELALSPDGATVYTLLRFHDEERAIAAWSKDARLRWSRPLNTSSADVAVGSGWVAVATAFETVPTPKPATLRAYDEASGVVVYERTLDGIPLALAADGKTLAVAYQAARNPVLVFEDFRSPTVVSAPGLVSALDASNGTVAGGTQSGRIVAWRGGREVLNVTAALYVRSVKLDADARYLAVGGFSLKQSDLSGGLAYYDLATRTAPWTQVTANGVSFVDLSEDGSRLLAMQEQPGQFILDFFDAKARIVLWSYRVVGSVRHADDGSNAGVALSPDGRRAVVAPLSGDIVLLDVAGRAEAWRYHELGATSAAFARESPTTFATDARLAPQRPYDGLLVFDTDTEPFVADPARLVPALVVLEAAVAAVVLGLEFHREPST